MATVFKQLLNNDVASTRTLLHEAIPLTGALASGSYGTFGSEENVKNYAHGMFQSVYDYPFLSSSANHIFDITMGFSNDSAMSQSATSQRAKKINIYNQMAQVLAGHDHTGSIRLFDEDGNILAGGTKIREAYFLCFSRLLVKDEIKKGSVVVKLGSSTAYASPNATQLTITDAGAASDFRVNSPVGEYGILSASSGEGGSSAGGLCGLVFYQAGVMVITASVFSDDPTGKIAGDAIMNASSQGVTASFLSQSIQNNADYLRHRLYDVDFNNTTELNSTIHFCRANHNEFNYSSNPTYLSASKINIKNTTTDQPVAYITTVGLYSPDNELLAVAKLSEPIKKTSESEINLRVRLDY